MTLDNFLNNNGIDTVEFRQGNGRAFADVINRNGQIGRIFVSSDCDLDQPLFVHQGKYDAPWVTNTEGAETVKVYKIGAKTIKGKK